jgi:hypothetical protein
LEEHRDPPQGLVDMKRNWLLSESDKAQIVRDYMAGVDARTLGRRHGVSGTAIGGLLRRRGVPIRGAGFASRRYSVNASAFRDMDDNDTQYWLGFLTADGMLKTNERGQYELRVVLSHRDVSHLELFRAFLKSSSPIKEVAVCGYPGSTAARRISVYSDELGRSMEAIGFAKDSLNRVAPASVAFSPHFWRGVVDGDGWIGFHRSGGARMDLVGGRELMTQFSRFVAEVAPRSAVMPCPHKSIYRVGLSYGTAFAVIASLYGDHGVSLKRKQEVASRIIVAG